jgi:hypothetical protein
MFEDQPIAVLVRANPIRDFQAFEALFKLLLALADQDTYPKCLYFASDAALFPFFMAHQPNLLQDKHIGFIAKALDDWSLKKTNTEWIYCSTAALKRGISRETKPWHSLFQAGGWVQWVDMMQNPEIKVVQWPSHL